MARYGETQIQDDIVELKVGQARLEERVHAMDTKIDDINDGVKELRKNGDLDKRATTNFWRSWTVKLLMVLIGGGVGGAAVTGFVKAMDDKPPAQEQVVSPDKQIP